MIKLFRNFRKNLLTDAPSEASAKGGGKTTNPSYAKASVGTYLKYAIGEIILVVIGILIALSINNWNEKQKLNAKKQDYYVQLIDDLKSDIKFSKDYLEESSAYLKEYESYTDGYHKDVLTPNQVYEQISKLDLETTPLTFNTSTIESLQSTGDIGLIPSNIRNRLVDLKRLQALTIKRFEDTDNGKSDITQNLSLLLGSTTLPKRLVNQPKLKEFLNIDENLKKLILVYEGIHRWKSISLNETKERLEEMQKEINTIMELINTELKT